MRVGLVLLIAVPLLSGCRSHESPSEDNTNFSKRVECAELSSAAQWEDMPDGPYLDNTYYSPSLDTCVFSMKRTFRGEKDGNIQYTFYLVDALTRKQLWANDPQAGETEEQINAKLGQALQNLQIKP